MLRAIIVDDEPLAREELAEHLSAHGKIEVIGQFSNAIEFLKNYHQLKADVLFVDIHMPKITGLEMVTMLDEEERPLVVFVTAYDQYAIQAFEDNAFDYLLKPIDEKRINKTLNRIEQAAERSVVQELPGQQLKLVPCFLNKRVKLVQLADIEYAFSDHTGVHIVTAQGKNHTQLTLKILEDKSDLVRCHRQYLVHPSAIREIELNDNHSGELKTQSGHAIPVSRRHLKELKLMFGIHNPP